MPRSRQPSPRPFSLDGLLPPTVPAPVSRLVQAPLERLLSLHRLDRWYTALPPSGDDREFLAQALACLQVDYRVPDAELAGIPREGALLVVANHPFGGLEGILIAALLRSVREDVKIVANGLLHRIPELRHLFLGVDPFGGEHAARRNVAPLREGLKTLEAGGCLVVFPAGEVSHLDLRRGVITDPQWNDHAAKLALRAGAPVLPVYFHGANSWVFQAAGLVHPRLRTALLPRQLVNKCRKTVTLSIGSLIPAERLAGFSDDGERTAYLRLRTYLMSRSRERREAPSAAPAPLAIVPAVAPARLEREVNALPPECRMAESGEFQVFAATAAQIPGVLEEIGRLREITFRATGEGTGHALDLDRYDEDYTHLFVWNPTAREVVGAYRLGFADTLLEQRGKRGLYSHSLFRYKTALLERMNPAIELGRSFVREEYQKSYSALMLLWKGIGALIARNPRYTTLFGPVSISNAYQSSSQRLLVEFLTANNLLPEYTRLVRPRKPFRAVRGGLEGGNALTDADLVSDLVASLEPDRKGMPVLLRQYLKLGGNVLAFNVDPAFNDALDGLIMLDLRATDPRVLARYMGKEAAATFLAFHGIGKRAA